ATRQIAKYLRDHRGQERIGRLKSYRKTIQTDLPRVGGYADVTVWRIGTGSSSEQAIVPPNGSSSGGMPEAPEIPGGLLHDRGRGPERAQAIAVFEVRFGSSLQLPPHDPGPLDQSLGLGHRDVSGGLRKSTIGRD